MLLDNGHELYRGITHPDPEVYRQKPEGKVFLLFIYMTLQDKVSPDLSKSCFRQGHT